MYYLWKAQTIFHIIFSIIFISSSIFMTLYRNLYLKHCLIQMFTTIIFQTCEIKADGGKRFLTLHKVKLDQAGEVLYQALNAVTTAILTVKGMNL